MTRNSWVRKAWTTRGADPTVVVRWSNDALKLELTEFQGEVLCERAGERITGNEELCAVLADLHSALEAIHENLEFTKTMTGWHEPRF